MTDPLLERATRALRERHEGTSDQAEATRARVLASLGEQAPPLHRARRGRASAGLVLLAATLAVATAWGAGSGRLRELVEQLSAPRDAPASTTPTPPAATAPPVTASPPVAESAQPMPSQSEEERSPVAPRASAPAGIDADESDALYERAHRLQTAGTDLAATVSAWDRYLAKFPSGAFCLEARFDRAVDLVKLGRTGSARAALEPFARGDYGSYRRADARALLQTLPP